LVLVGDGIEKKFLEDKVITYELKKQVWFYGSLYDENKIGELFYNASLCVSPGNVGLTSIHALTFGCPVITHNNFKRQMPEFEAIERGVTGDFFDENDSESLRTTIVKWFKEHPVKNSDLVNNCYKIVDTFYNPIKQIKLLKSLLK
jgi:glycosyltransferase involved in cell wall biosynthesis